MTRITPKGPLVTLAVCGRPACCRGTGQRLGPGPLELSSIDPTRESFSIDIGTSESIAVASSTVVTDNKDPDKLHPGQRSPVVSGDAYDGIIAILIG